MKCCCIFDYELNWPKKNYRLIFCRRTKEGMSTVYVINWRSSDGYCCEFGRKENDLCRNGHPVTHARTTENGTNWKFCNILFATLNRSVVQFCGPLYWAHSTRQRFNSNDLWLIHTHHWQRICKMKRHFVHICQLKLLLDYWSLMPSDTKFLCIHYSQM